jgi:4-hydroxy-3-polyprenylbenzoate decarboxylase
MKNNTTIQSSSMPQHKRLIIGITGASGAILGVEALKQADALGIETHLIMSKPGEMTLQHETSLSIRAVRDMACHFHKINDITASIASGSFKTMGMLIAPCSINSLAAIANSISSNLLTRAADVQVKEKRALVLMVRETPLHTGHLRAMLHLSQAGAVIMPPVPAFYTKPNSVDDIVQHTIARALDFFGLDAPTSRWGDGSITSSFS